MSFITSVSDMNLSILCICGAKATGPHGLRSHGKIYLSIDGSNVSLSPWENVFQGDGKTAQIDCSTSNKGKQFGLLC